ncbi:MAG: glycosyltransferase family 9 protein, partial [Flavobacteriales bacterium]
IMNIREEQYDLLINLHRFSSSGIISYFSKAIEKRGFDKNPFSFCYNLKAKHEIGNGKHEVERNHELIKDITDGKYALPKLYPSKEAREKVRSYQNASYITIAPASVWYTKQLPKEKWVEFIKKQELTVYLIGGKNDHELCEEIVKETEGDTEVKNISGNLNFLETGTLMKAAEMNYVNDSAPLHIASAVNAPVKAVFCSTVPEFGLHGYSACPKGHFKCAWGVVLSE